MVFAVPVPVQLADSEVEAVTGSSLNIISNSCYL